MYDRKLPKRFYLEVFYEKWVCAERYEGDFWRKVNINIATVFLTKNGYGSMVVISIEKYSKLVGEKNTKIDLESN